MTTTYEGNLDAKGFKFAIVCSRFNDFIVNRLQGGAMDALMRHGASEKDISIIIGKIVVIVDNTMMSHFPSRQL